MELGSAYDRDHGPSPSDKWTSRLAAAERRKKNFLTVARHFEAIWGEYSQFIRSISVSRCTRLTGYQQENHSNESQVSCSNATDCQQCRPPTYEQQCHFVIFVIMMNPSSKMHASISWRHIVNTLCWVQANVILMCNEWGHWWVLL